MHSLDHAFFQYDINMNNLIDFDLSISVDLKKNSSVQIMGKFRFWF